MAFETMESPLLSTYAARVQTFQSYWDNDMVTARQLAAIGHVCDQPPLYSSDEGSHCILCKAFVKREASVKALGGSTHAPNDDGFGDFKFHQPSCKMLQTRIPLEPQSSMGLYTYSMQDVRAKWERKITSQTRPTPGSRVEQSSSLFSLPTELRLEIYRHILPDLPRYTPIMQLNRDSARVITGMGYCKAGPLDATKHNILRTCRAVHEEAADLLYANTTFQFYGKDGTKVLYLFLRAIGQAGRDLLTAVDVQCGNREDAIAFALLASCGKLKAITIRLPRGVILTQRPPIWCIDGMACLLDMSGLERVKFGTPDSGGNWYMSDEKTDADVMRKELMREKDSPGDAGIIGKYLEQQPSGSQA